MEKNILNEVKRIGNLMGVKPLITEQAWLINLLKNAGDNYIASAAKSIDNFVSSKAKDIYDNGKITKQQYDNLVAALKNKGDDAIKYVKSGGDDVNEYINRISSNPSVQKTFRKVVVGLTDAELQIMRKNVAANWDGLDYWYRLLRDRGFEALEKSINKFKTKEDFVNGFYKLDTTGAFKDWPEVLDLMKTKLLSDTEVDNFFSKRSVSTTTTPTTSVSKVAGSTKGSKFYGKMELPDGTIKDIPSNTYYSKEIIDDIDYMIHKNIDGSEIPEGKIKLTRNVADEAPGYKFYDSMKLPDGTVVRIPEDTYYVRETIDNVDYLIQRNVDGDEILAGRRRMDNPNITTPRDEVEPFDAFQGTNFNFLEKLYWNLIEPWYFPWTRTIRVLLTRVNKRPNMANLMRDFEKAFSQGVKQSQDIDFTKADSAYLRKTIRKFQDLASGYQGKETTTGIVYQELWKDFIARGRKHLETATESEKEKFEKFVDALLNFKDKTGRTASFSDIFGKTKGKVVDDMVEADKKLVEKMFERIAPEAATKTINFLTKNASKVLSLVFSSRFQTPAEYSLAIYRDRTLRQKLKIFDKDYTLGSLPKTFSKQKSLAAWQFTNSFLTKFIMVPLVYGTAAALIDGDNAYTENIKAKGNTGNMSPSEIFFYNYIFKYISTGKNPIGDLWGSLLKKLNIKKDKNGESWYDVVLEWFPGIQDQTFVNAMIWVANSYFGLGEGEYESKEEKNEAEKRQREEMENSKDLEQYKKEGLYKRKIPEQSGDLSENAIKFKGYLLTPLSRQKVPKDGKIDEVRAAYVTQFIRSDSNNLWVEDPSYEKKYTIKRLEENKKDYRKPTFVWLDGNTEKSIYDLVKVVARRFDVSKQRQNEVEKFMKNKLKSKLPEEPTTIGENNIYNYNLKRSIMENNGKKFGEDNFKHWKKTFTFYNFDNESGEYKEVKITSKMDEIMDTIDHYRKKYDEDDSFVRAVVDVFGDKIDRVSFNKDMAQLTESVRVFGLMKVLANIRESKELEIWTVKHYSDGNWELVKGSFNKKELQNVGKTVKNREKEQEERKKPVDGLKKKEEEVISALKSNEDSIMNNLPIKVKEKVREKLSKGWTTEIPFSFFEDFFTKSEINSAFSGKIEIFKLKPSKEFLNSLAINSSRINVKKGFCKSLKNIEGEIEMNDRQKNIVQHFIKRCENKFQNQIKKYKPKFND